MTFTRSAKLAFLQTKNCILPVRLLCILIEFYAQSLQTRQRARLLITFLQILKQKIAYFYLAKLAYLDAQYSKALNLLESYLQTKPDNVDALYLKMRLLVFLKKGKEFLKTFELCLKNSNRLKTFIEAAALVENEKELQQFLDITKANENNFAKFQNNQAIIKNELSNAAKNAKNYALAKQYAKESLFLKQKTTQKLPMRYKDAKEALRDLAVLLEKNGIEMFLISGLFLGAIREKNILKHDYDLDVGIDAMNLETLQNIFSSSPVWTLKNTRYKGGIQANHSNGVYVDVFFHYEENGFLYHDGDFVRWKNSPFELERREFLGSHFLMPKDFELYLSENYGKEWRKNKNSKEYNTFLDTPNMEITNKEEYILCLMKLLKSEFAKDNEERILTALLMQGEQQFVQEYKELYKGKKL
ncbi:hypothetical protein OQH60_05685 [Campylobacter sp. MIT 21-1685]|uniref:hypothetical protein n=1 Tax=unclassified Campylobacter TaxID=2593542 RepID=UPI00224B06B5|nr:MULTISPECIES: hypothetical protein [unclassified Campylobacter]MCX2683307.1 hypothetical protein [Campylobacter sp. MIT 21-1684]MCX2751637.1 hypothetical protein [Campylobacter sp. MIT 21-1682]MCX2807837.1 hypothetical protein [Campylobacter sp. MIT 21-1685]